MSRYPCRRDGGRAARVWLTAALFSVSVAVCGCANTGVERSGDRFDSRRGSGSTARRVLPAGGLWGVALGLHPEEASRRDIPFPPDLGELATLGIRDLLLPVAWAQQGIDGSSISERADTLDDDVLLDLMLNARALGLRTSLMPMVSIDDAGPRQWRGVIAPRDRDDWWRSYARFIRHYARIAERGQATMLVIGSELSSMTGVGDWARWRGLVRLLRHDYGGLLTYGAHHQALGDCAPFEFVDVIGVSAYPSLTHSLDPDGRELLDAWRGFAGELTRLAATGGKPLVLLEVGYPSIDGGARRPWDYTRGAPIDLGEQRDAYRAAVSTMIDTPAIAGAFFWTWFGPGGVHDRHYTPRGKPAQDEVERLMHWSAARHGDAAARRRSDHRRSDPTHGVLVGVDQR